jgi:putative DNA primase/helicase
MDKTEKPGIKGSRKRARSTKREKLASRFFDGSEFVPARLGEHLLEEASIRLGQDRHLWRYENGVYRPDGDEWARQRTRELVGNQFRRNHLEEVIAYLRAQLPSLGPEPHQQFINCRNGLLDWQTGRLRRHSPDVLSTNQTPVEWNPTATAPTFARFLSEVVPEDAIAFVEEVMGYALYAGNPFRKAVLLVGPGGNGKSVLLRVLSALLGKENVSSVALQTLGEDRFAAADLFGKLANICGDLDARAIYRTDLFKQITGGDPIRAQYKFRDAFTFVSYALPLFSANEVPYTKDQTDGWFDRWIVIPMLKRFEGTGNEDPDLSDKLAAEVEGVLVCAVTGLRRLMARGRFVFPPSVEAARSYYRQTVDTVRAFVAEECHLDPEEWVDRAEFYQAYRKWCTDENRFALRGTTFNTQLLQGFGDKIVLRKRKGRPGWSGIERGPEVRRCRDCKEKIFGRDEGECENCGREHGRVTDLRRAQESRGDRS